MTPVRAQILSVGYDATVFDSRNRVLESAGFQVAACFTPESATSLFTEQVFDIVVLCDSLSGDTRTSLVNAFREARPSVPILIVYRVGEMADDVLLADAAVESLDGPERLIQAVFSLLHKPVRPASVKPSFKQSAG